MPAQIGEQLGLTLLEALDTELKPVAVALAEAVVVELAYEGGKVGVLERPRQLRRLQQVGLPDGERAALRGPGDDVVAAGIADEVPRFPAWGGRAASEDGVGRRGTGGVISAGRGKFPRASARRGTFSRARLRASQVTAQDGRIDRGSGRHAGARRDASHRAGTSGRYREDIGRWPAPRASRDGTPPRSTCQNKKKLGTSGGGGGTARRTIGTVTRSRWRTGSWRPSRCPAARSRPWPRSCPRE